MKKYLVTMAAYGQQIIVPVTADNEEQAFDWALDELRDGLTLLEAIEVEDES